MMLLLALALMFQASVASGPGFGGVNFDWNQMIETAASIEHAKRFAPVPMASWGPAVGATFADLAFMRAVEDFAVATPTEPAIILFARMGSNEWRERDAAARRAEAYFAANPGEARWLFRGRRHPDPEIRLRSNAILRRLNPCGTCKGGGQSKNWELYPCWDCNGTGTTWPWSMWD